jgi:hypothetical protein
MSMDEHLFGEKPVSGGNSFRRLSFLVLSALELAAAIGAFADGAIWIGVSLAILAAGMVAAFTIHVIVKPTTVREYVPIYVAGGIMSCLASLVLAVGVVVQASAGKGHTLALVLLSVGAVIVFVVFGIGGLATAHRLRRS